MPQRKTENAPRKARKAENVEFTYRSPVNLVESAGASKPLKINGVAINATTTRNNVRYTEEELKKSADSLNGKPLLKDHDQKIDNIVGRVANARYENGQITYDAEVMDERIKEMIADGRIQNVSIGARVQELLEEGEGENAVKTARGLEFLELSFVAVPGDPNATVDSALQESFRKNAREVMEMDKDEKPFGNAKEADAPGAPGQAPAAPSGGVEQKLDQLIAMIQQMMGGMQGGVQSTTPNDKEDMAQSGVAPGTPPEGEMKDTKARKSEERIAGLEAEVKLLTEAVTRGKARVNVEEKDDGDDLVVEQYRGGLSMYRLPDYSKYGRK